MAVRTAEPTARGAATRARILTATRTLLIERGFRHVSMADVAERAHVAKGTPYRHWSSKETLVLELLATESQRGLEDVVADLEADHSLVVPGRMFGRLLHFALDRPLLRAVQLGDLDVMGILATDPRSAALAREFGAPALLRRLLDVWRTHGLARTDRPVDQQAYILEMLVVATMETSARAPVSVSDFAPEDRDHAIAGAIDDYLGAPPVDDVSLDDAAAAAITVLREAAGTTEPADD